MKKKQSLAKDISDMRLGVQSLITSTEVPEKNMSAVFYADTFYKIPFGWNAERNPSLASTAWYYFDLINFNPFRIDGQFKTTMHDLRLT